MYPLFIASIFICLGVIDRIIIIIMCAGCHMHLEFARRGVICAVVRSVMRVVISCSAALYRRSVERSYELYDPLIDDIAVLYGDDLS